MNTTSNSNASGMTNGSGAAAVLSAGAGCFALAILAIAADKSAALKAHIVFYKPTGPLSGVTTVAILFWLLLWLLLEWRWKHKTVSFGRIAAISLALLLLGMLLTFPPIADMF